MFFSTLLSSFVPKRVHSLFFWRIRGDWCFSWLDRAVTSRYTEIQHYHECSGFLGAFEGLHHSIWTTIRITGAEVRSQDYQPNWKWWITFNSWISWSILKRNSRNIASATSIRTLYKWFKICRIRHMSTGDTERYGPSLNVLPNNVLNFLTQVSEWKTRLLLRKRILISMILGWFITNWRCVPLAMLWSGEHLNMENLFIKWMPQLLPAPRSPKVRSCDIFQRRLVAVAEEVTGYI